jgi:hypothetical protein
MILEFAPTHRYLPASAFAKTRILCGSQDYCHMLLADDAATHCT